METAKVDIRKLQLLNDRICQTIDALNQVRLSVHGIQQGMSPGIQPGMSPMHQLGTQNPLQHLYGQNPYATQQLLGQQSPWVTQQPYGQNPWMTQQPLGQQNPYQTNPFQQMNPLMGQQPYGQHPYAQLGQQGFGQQGFGQQGFGQQGFGQQIPVWQNPQGVIGQAFQPWTQQQGGLSHTSLDVLQYAMDPTFAIRCAQTFPFAYSPQTPII